MPVQLILRSIPDGKVIKKFDSDQGTIKIGRGPRDSSDTLRLNSGRFRGDGTKVMSQSHASLSWEGGDSYKVPMLTDTKSTNGTWVERAGDATQLRPKVPYRLKQDDVITFGKQMDSRQSQPYEPLSLKVSITDVKLVEFVEISDDDEVAQATSSAPSTSRGPNTFLSKSPGPKLHSTEIDLSSDDEDLEAGTKLKPIISNARKYGLEESDLFSDTDSAPATGILSRKSSPGGFNHLLISDDDFHHPDFTQAQPGGGGTEPFEEADLEEQDEQAVGFDADADADADEDRLPDSVSLPNDDEEEEEEMLNEENQRLAGSDAGDGYSSELELRRFKEPSQEESDIEQSTPPPSSLKMASPPPWRKMPLSPELLVPSSSNSYSSQLSTFAHFMANRVLSDLERKKEPSVDSGLPSPKDSDSSNGGDDVIEHESEVEDLGQEEEEEPVQAEHELQDIVRPTSSHLDRLLLGAFIEKEDVAETGSQASHLPSPQSESESQRGQEDDTSAQQQIDAEEEEFVELEKDAVVEWEEEDAPTSEPRIDFALDQDESEEAPASNGDWENTAEGDEVDEIDPDLDEDCFLDETNDDVESMGMGGVVESSEDLVGQVSEPDADHNIHVEEVVEVSIFTDDKYPTLPAAIASQIREDSAAVLSQSFKPPRQSLKRSFSSSGLDQSSSTYGTSTTTDVGTSTTLDQEEVIFGHPIVPLPKRQKTEASSTGGYKLSHLAWTSAISFAAGAVATVAGLSSLESLFAE